MLPIETQPRVDSDSGMVCSGPELERGTGVTPSGTTTVSDLAAGDRSRAALTLHALWKPVSTGPSGPGGPGATGPGTTPAPSVHGHAKVHGKARAGHKAKLMLPEFLDLPAGHRLKVVWYVDGKKVKAGAKLKLKLKRAWRGHTLKVKVTESWVAAGSTRHLKVVSKAIRIR